MTLDELFDMWSEDARIDSSELSEESLKIPRLHHKYMRMLSKERLELKRRSSRYDALRNRKTIFYQDGPDEETNKLGWRMPARGKILKTEVKQWVDSDRDVVMAGNAVAEQAEVVEALVEIVKSINNRTYVIGNSIKFLQFTNGVGG